MEDRPASDGIRNSKPIEKESKVAFPVNRVAVRAPETLDIRSHGLEADEKGRHVARPDLKRQPLVHVVPAEDASPLRRRTDCARAARRLQPCPQSVALFDGGVTLGQRAMALSPRELELKEGTPEQRNSREQRMHDLSV
jgi:hypothetical protein